MRDNDFNVGLRGTLFEAKHYERMSSAVWLYGWLVLRQTRQDGSTGWVGGSKKGGKRMDLHSKATLRLESPRTPGKGHCIRQS